MTPGLVDLLPDGVVIVERTGHVTEANRAATRLTGYGRHELIGQSFVELLDARDCTGQRIPAPGWPVAAAWRSVRSLAPQTLSVRHRNGSHVPVVIAGTYQRHPDGALTGAVLSLRPAARRPAATGIEIVSTVSHELRAPLTSVKGYTSLLINRWDRLGDDEKRMMLEQINQIGRAHV